VQPLVTVLVLGVSMLTTVAMAGTVCDHRVREVRVALRHLGRRAPEVLALGALYLLALLIGLVLLSLPVAAVGIAMTEGTSALWTGTMMNALNWLAAAAAIAVYARLGLAFQYVLLTRRGALLSIRASWRLTRGRFPRMLGYVALALLPTEIALLAAPRAASALLAAAGAGSWSSSTVAATGAGLLQLVWFPYAQALLLLVWLNLRGEEEQVDADHLAREISRSGRHPMQVLDDGQARGSADGGLAPPPRRRRRHR
jgi:hypothetical protein